jgi:hypothetical protein
MAVGGRNDPQAPIGGFNPAEDDEEDDIPF